jgi:hypothetical protein
VNIKKILEYISALIFAVIIIYIIWQPVFPSKFIRKGMAERIDVKSLNLERPVVIRFYLTGKGGGVYNIVVDKDKASVVEDDTDRIDLVLKMEAREFNNLMYSLATGKASDSAFISRIISKRLTTAGDMNIMRKLFSR